MLRSTALLAFLVAASPAQTGLVAEGAKVTKLCGGFRFTEGPAADAEGHVFFSDIPNDRIHRWSVAGKLTTWREDSGGANGLFFDAKGRLLACEGKRRRVVAITMKGRSSTLASRCEGKRLNSPNDLWIDPRGAVWFTDPRYGSQAGLEQTGFHVYRIAPGGGGVTRVIDDMTRPNGIVGTKDGKTLYVADHGAKKVWRYRVTAEGGLADRRIHVEGMGSDGMTLDEKGNLYLTWDAVYVHAPDGKRLARIEIPERPANVCFGGKDRRSLFVTARTSLYSLRMAVKGQ